MLPLLGADINSARVPIIDTLGVGAANNSGFVDGDFSENVGLSNDASPKYFNSQIFPSQLGVSNNGGLGWWETNIGFGGVEPIGCYGSSLTTRFVLDIRSTLEAFRWGNPATSAQLLTAPTNGHYYGQRSSTVNKTLYVDGAPVAYGNGTPDSATWKWRLKYIWHILRTGRPYGDEVILSEPQMKELLNYIQLELKRLEK